MADTFQAKLQELKIEPKDLEDEVEGIKIVPTKFNKFIESFCRFVEESSEIQNRELSFRHQEVDRREVRREQDMKEMASSLKSVSLMQQDVQERLDAIGKGQILSSGLSSPANRASAPVPRVTEVPDDDESGQDDLDDEIDDIVDECRSH